MSDGKIILNKEDYTVLTRLVDSLERTGRLTQPHFNRLAREMKHAVVMNRDEIPNNVITMGSRVNYTCIETGTTTEAILVFPAQAKDGESHVSILAPLGLALIGERDGTEVEYVAPGGTYRIRINAVEHTGMTQTARA
jgi:regulator of nucleoside diphosphate kinase